MLAFVHKYTVLARIMHWLSAFLILVVFGIGFWMVDLDYYHQWYNKAPHYHRSVGILLGMLTLLRLAWKAWSSAPKIIGKPYDVLLAKIVHYALYFLLFTLFGSGYLISTSNGKPIEVFDWLSIPSLGRLFADQAYIAGVVHFYAGWTLLGLAALHALAALKHHFVDKDDTLRKMI